MNSFALQLITKTFSLELEEMGNAKIKACWRELLRAAIVQVPDGTGFKSPRAGVG